MQLLVAIFMLVSGIGVVQHASSSSLLSASIELCGPETEISLSGSGEMSSMTVTLSPIDHNSVCKLRVTAPKTHAINMHFIETSAELHRALEDNNDSDDDDDSGSNERHPPCVMSILLPENPRFPVWKGDPCSADALAEVDLLTSDFKIIWNPPANPSFTKGRKFVLTAVGQGPVCKEPDQHTCMKIGWDPMLCVSDLLLCDGVPNCPKASTSSDEDEKLCKSHLLTQSTWEQLAVEIFKKLKTPSDLLNNNKWLHEKLEEHSNGGSSGNSTKKSIFDWRELQHVNKNPTTTKKPMLETKTKASDSISQVLSKYGPWGYLMLGMLICGTVLMFCGLWECCFRKPKTQIEVPTHTQPRTVLVMNQQQPPPPPNYDDLDQPPSYTTLFPNTKNDELEGEGMTAASGGASNSATNSVSDINQNNSNTQQQRDCSEITITNEI